MIGATEYTLQDHIGEDARSRVSCVQSCGVKKTLVEGIKVNEGIIIWYL